jgi:1,2-diacylglycerol 3-alpha-glucosyltransferase
MNIVMIAGTYAPSINGAAISTQSFKHELERQGHTVWLIAPRYPGFVDREPRVLRRNSWPNPFYQDIRMPMFFSTRPTIKALAGAKIDVVHFMQPYIVGRFARRLARQLGASLVFTWHTRYDLKAHYVRILPTGIVRAYVKRTTVGLANKCNAIIAPSQSLKDFLVKEGVVTPVHVVPTGLTQNFYNSGSRELLRKKVKVPANAFLFLCVARIAMVEKNLDLLVRAFAKIYRQIPNSLLLFVGGGPDQEKLAQLAHDMGMGERVRFSGFVPHNLLDEYYSSADVFAYPSTSETQGLILAEAMSAGAPVVAVDAPGSRDIVKNNLNGLLTKNSVEDFSEALLRIASDYELRKNLAQAGQKTSHEYSIEATTKQLVAVYKSL